MLPDLVYSYNHSLHRSIKMKPALVSKKNEDEVWHTLYDDTNSVVKPFKHKFRIGDQVRISKVKRRFEKGYLPNFSKEIFTIRFLRQASRILRGRLHGLFRETV